MKRVRCYYTQKNKSQNTLTLSNGGKRNSRSLLVGIQNGLGTLGDSLPVSYKIKHTLINNHDLTIALTGTYQKELKTYAYTKIYT